MVTGKRLYYNCGKKNNDHINRNIEMFEAMGIECIPFHFFPQGILHKGDIVYLNWYENVYNGCLMVAVMQFVLKNATLIYAKIAKADVCASQHNRMQHDAVHLRLSQMMYRRVYKCSKYIIVFSEEAKKDLRRYLCQEDIDSKVQYIPPVNYIGVYKKQCHKWISELESEECMTILMLGSLNHSYKNLDMVIRIAKELSSYSIKFILAGKVESNQKDLVKKSIKDYQNIIGVFRFVEDDEIVQLIEISDLLIMPYDIESMSNSGTARLAFSYGRTIICPRIPSLERIPQEIIFSYSYSDKSDHYRKVKKCILNAFDIYKDDKKELKYYGEKLQEIMRKENSPELVSEKYHELFFYE